MKRGDVFERLRDHIDKMPIAYPATESGVELRILRRLFTPEEAEMALHLSGLPEPLETIHARARKDGIELDALRKGLKRLAAKGAISRRWQDGKTQYSKAMLAIGMFEYQVNRLTPEFHADMLQYMDEGFRETFHTKKTSQLRPIPINEEILPERTVGTYDGARELVMDSEGPFAVMPCVCRQGMDLLGEPCRQTDVRDTCLLLGSAAKAYTRTGTAKGLSREEMLGLLERADQEGMVLQPQNTQDPHFICCCCGCCCGVLASVKKLPRPAEYFDNNFYAAVDEELCTECGTCGDRCQMDAISYEDGVATVDLSACIGCGLCVTTCPDEAIRLFEKPETKTPPATEKALYMKILLERYGPLGAARIAGKKALGMKI